MSIAKNPSRTPESGHEHLTNCSPLPQEFHMARSSFLFFFFNLSSQRGHDDSCKSLSFARDKFTHHFILLSKGSNFFFENLYLLCCCRTETPYQWQGIRLSRFGREEMSKNVASCKERVFECPCLCCCCCYYLFLPSPEYFSFLIRLQDKST